MKKTYTIFLALVTATSMWAEAQFTNPVLPYDYSDPDVCRVGDVYLMTSSSFNNIPGLQILSSKDLVHWDIVDAALPYQLPGYEAGCRVLGNFVWAPSIREHKGTLYIYYGDPDRGIWVVRATLPTLNKGEALTFPLAWEAPKLVIPAKGYIDPCPLWDEDGRCYLVHGVAGSRRGLKSVLMMAELTGDGMSVRVPSRIIYDGHEQDPTCEGPKLYKRGQYYYIFHPAGGVEFGWQVVQRSQSIYGPYERKVTLRQGSTAINGPHQGGYVETPKGEGWFMHFQDVGVAGRIVHLQPVTWQDEWPVMGTKCEPVTAGVVRTLASVENTTWSDMSRRDEFDAQQLGLDWQWAGGYINPAWYYCDAQNSRLRLYSYPKGEELMENMLLQKIPYAAFTATCRVRFTPNPNPKRKGIEEAGMIVFGQQSFHVSAPAGEWVYLQLRMSAKQKGRFYTSTDGKQWTEAGEEFQATAGKWIGAQVGLYCTRDDRKINDSGYMDVDWFEIKLEK